MKKQYLEVGKIVSTSGIRGEVRVQPWCDSPEFLRGFARLYFADGTPLSVEKSHVQKNVTVLKLTGVDTVEAANLLRGKVLYIDRNDVTLDDRTFFVQDLIGLTVQDADDPSITYGTLSEVSETGANDVYHIQTGEREVLIPAIRQVIIETDVDAGVMKIRPLAGLFDDEN